MMLEPPVIIERFGSHLWEYGATLVPWVVVLAAVVAATLTDVRTRRIPNALTFPLFLSGLGWAVVVGGGMGLADAMLGAVAAMLPFVILFVLAHGGAGDAKLMAGVGVWLGLNGGLIALACVLIAGGIMSLIVTLVRGKTADTWTNLTWIFWGVIGLVAGGRERDATLLPSVRRMQVMPYGVSILVGVIATLGVTLS